MNDERYWLCAAVDPPTNRILHVRLFPGYPTEISREVITELSAKLDVEDAVFRIDDARELERTLRREGSRIGS